MNLCKDNVFDGDLDLLKRCQQLTQRRGKPKNKSEFEQRQIGQLIDQISTSDSLRNERGNIVISIGQNNVESFGTLCELHDEILTICSSRKRRLTYLHLALIAKADSIVSYIMKRSARAIVPPSDDAYCADNRNVISVLYALADVGGADILKQLLNACSDETTRKFLLTLCTTPHYVDIEAKISAKWPGGIYANDQNPQVEFVSIVEMMYTNGHTDLVKLLVSEAECSPSLQSDSLFSNVLLGLTRRCCLHADDDFAEYLLAKLVIGDIDRLDDRGFTALHYAACCNDANVVEILVDKGNANVNASSTAGGRLKFPIVFAATLGYASVVEVLLKRAPVPESVTGALHAAAASGNNDIVKLILSSSTGADDAKARVDLTDGCKFKEDVDSTDADGNTALLIAANIPTNLPTVKLLLESGARLDRCNRFGEDVWTMAMRNNDTALIRHLQVLFVDKMMEFGKFSTPIHDAVRYSQEALIGWLLEFGADPRRSDDNGDTFVHVAVRLNKCDVVRSLLPTFKELALVSNKDSKSAFHLAAESYNLELVDLILRNLGPLCRVDSDGSSPLHVAAALPDCVILKLLLESFPADTNMQKNTVTKSGRTPLMACVVGGNVHGVELLLNVGVDIAATNDYGENVIHVLVKHSIDEPQTCVNIWNVIVAFVDGKVSDKHASRERLLELIQPIDDRAYVSPLQLATVIGAVDILEAIVNSTSRLDGGFIDAELIAPRFIFRSLCRKLLQNTGLSTAANQNTADNQNTAANQNTADNHANSNIVRNPMSCLELMSIHCSQKQIAEMVRINPIKVVLKSLSKLRRMCYVVVFITHIVFMTLFTATAVQPISHNSTTNATQFSTFPVWPGCIAAFDLYCFLKWLLALKTLSQYKKNYAKWQFSRIGSTSPCVSDKSAFHFAFRKIREIGNKLSSLSIIDCIEILSHIFSMTFYICCYLWSFAYLECGAVGHTSCKTNYVTVTATTVLYGWIMTIEYVKGFTDIYYLVIMIKIIFAKDVLRMLCLYLLTIIGFTSAMYICMPIETGTVPDFAYVLFQMYGTMLSLGSFFDTQTSLESTAILQQNQVLIVRITMAEYTFLVTVVFTNILIAMMQQTYESVQNVKDTLSYVDDLNFVFWISQDNLFGLRSVYRWIVRLFLVRQKNNFYVMEATGYRTDNINIKAMKQKGAATDQEKPIF